MSKLFEPWEIRNLKLNNKIVIAPMCQYSADDGKATDWHTIHLGNLVHSGAGMLIIEATAVQPCGRITYKDLGLYDEHCESALKKVLQSVKKYSSMPIAVQLAHAGRKASTEIPWRQRRQLKPNEKNGWLAVAPSPISFNQDENLPKELSVFDLKKIISDFVIAAERAIRVGFDAIELHAAHGYLLHQFLSPISNHRKDEYGGSLENRMRFPLEVFKEIRQTVPFEVPVWVRISATDWIENGWSIEDSIIFCQKLKELNCDLIHVSSGGLSPKQNIPQKIDFQIELSKIIREQAAIKTIAVGLVTDPIQAEEILQQKKADAIGIARAVLYNPRWPWHAAAQLNAEVKCPPQFLRSQPDSIRKLLIPDLIDKEINEY